MGTKPTTPLPDFAKPLRDIQICAARAQGLTVQAVADEVQCSKTTAETVLREHREYVDEMVRKGARTFLRDFEGMVGALATTAADSTNRNQVGAFKEGCEKLLGLGLRHGGDVNIGEINMALSDDRRTLVLAGDSEELRRIRSGLGL